MTVSEADLRSGVPKRTSIRTDERTDELTESLPPLPEITSSSVTRTRTYGSKACPECGETFNQRPDEYGYKWERRAYCDRVCVGKASRRKQLGQGKDHREYIISEVVHILGTDSPDNIAKRLGYVSTNGLMDSLRRWDRPDLAERLVAA